MFRIKRVLILAVCLMLVMECFAGYAPKATAFTPPLVTNSQIVYPISLSTGLDAAGREVFPDKNFWEHIKKATFQTGSYSGYTFDLDEDGTLSQEECETVRVLSINEREDISSIEGIEAFPKLRELYCSNTGITEIDLSNNPRLQILTCSHTAITELDVSVCPLLRELKVSGCRLTSLDVHFNSKLELLTCMTQERPAFEYKQDGKYKVQLTDWDKTLDLSRVSNVSIDGAPGDGINSGYDAQTGTVYCSDEIKKVAYEYDVNLGSVMGESIDSKMYVTLHVKPGYREYYDTNGGTKILPQYVEEGKKDTEPEQPLKDGYRFIGWYTQNNSGTAFYWPFRQILGENISLYAHWEKKQYQVHYDMAGGSLAVNEKKGTVDWWSAGLLPEETPVKEGFVLTGWLSESGQLITTENAASITYGQASGDSSKESTTLTAQWEAVKGYQLAFATEFSDTRKNQVENMPEKQIESGLLWESWKLVPEDIEPVLPGYNFIGWYTSPAGGIKVTEATAYCDIYKSQFAGTGTGTDQIPTLYARFEKKKLTIYYDERGGSKVADRTGILWGSKNLLPATKTKKKNYIFAGWKCNGKKVTKKTTTNSISDGLRDTVTLTAYWYKKYEKKGTVFKRYGYRYKVTQSNKKGNKVRLIRVSKKKVRLYHKVFYNGKFFNVSSIKKKALKRKKVVLQVPKRKTKKYRKMAKTAGGKLNRQ